MEKSEVSPRRRIMLVAVGLGVLAIILTGGALVQRAVSSPSQDNPASPVAPPPSSIPNPSDLESYWTDERMNSASPEPLRGP